MMQTILPDNFPVANLPPTERYKLEAYYDRFVIKRYREYGSGHLWLACYAALPAVMTPDLLYKIWLNFASYRDGKEMRILHVAVADLLLSPLFHEITFETYEMPVVLKNALLQYWQFELKDGNYNHLASLEDVAKFLLGYTQVFRTTDAKSDDAFREAQEITAWSYLDTQRASAMLLQSLEQASQTAMQESGNRLARAEQLRLLEVARLTSQRHDLGLMATGQSKPQNIEALAGYSQQLQSLLTGREEDVLRILQQSGSDLQLTDSPGPGISIKAPTALVKKTQPDEERNKGMLTLLMVGIDEYEDKSLQLQHCKNDVANFKAAFEQLGYMVGFSSALTDKEASISAVNGILQDLLDGPGPHDQILFLFVGHVSNTNNGQNLILHDSKRSHQFQGLELQQLFNWLKDNKNIPYLTLIIDEYIDDIQLPSPNIAIVAGGGQDAVEGSRFLNAMLPIWARSKGRISLQKMVAAVHNQMAAELSITNYENDRLPKLFAYPEAAQQPLVRTSSAVRQMQALLRSTGYSNGSVNGVYNQETDTALRAWLSVQNITGTPSPEDILYRLQEEKKKKEREDPKIMLFVFSNPDGQLPFVGDEQERLFALADDMEKRSGAELILLNSPSREELRIYFTEPTYRNQITLFHFSGFEADPQGNGRERGLFLQKDGEKDLIDYGELHHWLDFQENIRLFYLNTCYSSNLAKTLTIRGVQAAIGAPALVDDRYASNFALEFYQNMLTGLSLKDAFDRIDIRPSSEGQHRMAVMNEEAAFAGFQLFSDWGRREEILNWRWGRVEEQAQAKEEKPRKTATGLYLETLKELLNENEVEAALDRLEKYDGLFMLDFVSDLLSLKSRYIQTKREFEDGKLPQAQYDRNKNQVRFSLQNIIDEIPRKMAIQKSTGEARWMDFTLPAEEDMVKFEKKEELLEWLGKGLEAVKGIGKVTMAEGSSSLGFLIDSGKFICGSQALPNKQLAEKAKVDFFFGGLNENQPIAQSYQILLDSFISSPAGYLDYSCFSLFKIQQKGQQKDILIPLSNISERPMNIGDVNYLFIFDRNSPANLELIIKRITSIVETRIEYELSEINSNNSGAPVFDDNWNIIALCEFGGSSAYNVEDIIKTTKDDKVINQGVIITYILQDIQRQQSGGSTSYAA